MGFTFAPDRVAYYEAAGWRAYYERNWLKVFRLIVALAQEQFHIPFPVSLLAGYDVVRASAAWVPVDHDESVVREYLARFYRIARRYSGLTFDPDEAAARELRYYDVHRKLVGNPAKQEFVDAMAALHATLFGISLDEARESAQLRVLANNTVDEITSGRSGDVEADWQLLEEYLRQCYRAVQREQQSAS